MKVLITDDEKHVQEAVTMLVDWQKYGVTQIMYADNGKEALQILREEQPAILFCDMRMPVMDGVDLMGWIRKEAVNTLVIAISGYDDFRYARAAILANGVDYVLKPFDKKMLESAMDNAMERLDGIMESAGHKRRAEVSAYQMAGERVNDWIMAGGNITGQIGRDLQLLGIEKEKKIFLTAFLPENHETVLNDIMHGDRQLYIFVIRNIITEIMRQYRGNFFHLGDGSAWYLLSQPKYGVLGEHESRLRFLKQKLHEILGLECSYIFRNEAVMPEQLPEYLKTLKAAGDPAQSIAASAEARNIYEYLQQHY